jgi:hypothetical protein
VSVRSRLAKLDRSLPPREAVLLWFETASRYPSLSDYSRACLTQDNPRAYLGQIHGRVVASVADALAGERPPAIARATRLALRDAVFLYQLVLVLNATVADFAQLAYLRSLVVVRGLGPLMADVLSEDAEARRVDPDGARRVDIAWESWLESAEALVADVRVERIARASLDEVYFGGRSVLLPDAAEAWQGLVEQADRLAQIAEELREPYRTRAGIPPGWVMASEPADLAKRARWRAIQLADDARVAGFMFLGEDQPARAIVERELRG